MVRNYREMINMDYTPITPVGLLDCIDKSKARSAFILPHLWDIDEYRNFYQHKAWDRVILDNSVYELNMAHKFTFMLEIAKTLNAREIYIIGPENIDNGIRTAEMTVEVVEKYGNGEGRIDDHIWLMQILHKYPNEMREQYKMTKQYEDLAYGISVWSTRVGYSRTAIAHFVGLDPRSRYVHAFGLDNLLELHDLWNAGFSSVDTSMPVTAALNETLLKEYYQISRVPGFAGYTDIPRVDLQLGSFTFTADQRWQVLNNIDFIHELARTGNGCLHE